jgi:hypothetical protein
MSDDLQDQSEMAVVLQHAEAIGMLCIYMATLDHVITIFMERLLEIDETSAACVAASASDLSQRCEIVRRLVFLKAPSDDWRECVTGLINVIQNEVAPRRNRFVHDDWAVRENEMVRHDRRIKIQRPQSHQPAQLIHLTKNVAPVSEITEITGVVVNLMVHLTMLTIGYRAWRKTGTQPELPQQAIDLSKHKFLKPLQ